MGRNTNDYMRVYMRDRRIREKYGRPVHMASHRATEDRLGQCVFCSHKTAETVCDFCRLEIERGKGWVSF